MFDVKKFAALIGTDDVLMELYHMYADEIGITPRFDIYHIIEGKELPTEQEMAVMKKMYEKNIIGTNFETEYENSVENFPSRIAEKNKRRIEALKKKE